MGLSLARAPRPAQPPVGEAVERGRGLYAREAYAEALSHMGLPLAVPEWDGFMLTRAFGAARDAVGPYPLTLLPRDAELEVGIERLASAGLVSAVLVPDPLTGPPPERLARAFDLCRPFKTHWLIRAGGAAYAPSKHHRDRIRRAHRRCRVEPVRLADRLAEWTALYADLTADKAVSGPAAFPPAYFVMLAAQPELRAFAAYVGEALVAITLWFEHQGVAYNHLTASDALGRANGAGFALYDAAIEHFRDAVANLGGGAGAADDPDDGLAAFKRGFAGDSAVAHLCGAVLDPERYAALSAGRRSRFAPLPLEGGGVGGEGARSEASGRATVAHTISPPAPNDGSASWRCSAQRRGHTPIPDPSPFEGEGSASDALCEQPGSLEGPSRGFFPAYRG